MEFRILGPLEVVEDGEALPLGGTKQRAVLAHLILRANHPVHVDQLIDGLWGDDPPETARNTLQTYVYRLRKLLGEERVAGSDGGYVLNAVAEEIDAARFESILREAKAVADADPGAAASRYSDALAMWRGAPLADLADEPSLRGEIARLEELRLSAVERRIAAEIARGRYSTVVSELEALTDRYPLRERMWANLMVALYRSGRQAEALSAYERAREVLSSELGTDPSEQLQHLHEQILRRDPALARAEPRAPDVRPSRIDLRPGTEFASYRIERTLGRGGMSVVYLAQHEWLQRKVALKVLAPQLAEDDRFRERFIRESRLAASLDHPNVIPIYEAGASGSDLFIAMRYVEGSDLRTMLHDGGALDPAHAIAVVRQVAAALDAAHEQGLVHRDVKPGNVLLARARGEDETEHVYLSDFGLTKRSASDSGITGTGQFVGTLDYAAPEQFKGGAPDARTDVYSLGCVLFECLTGRPPFRSENDAGLMYAHLQEPPPPVTSEKPDLPKGIDGVVATAMAKEPAGRQQSAGALSGEASRALGLGAEREAPQGGRTPLRRLAPVFAVIVALVAGIAVASLFRGDAPPAEGGTPRSTDTASPSPTVPPTFLTVERPLEPAEEELLAYIPEDVSAECLPLDRDEPIHGERAALVCTTADLEVLYELFQTRDEMNAAFEVNVNNKRAPDGECATEHLAVTPYTIGGELAGRVLCYTVERGPFSSALPDQSHIEWTDENASIYAHAIRNDLSDLSLYEWWLSSSGPVLAADGGSVAVKDRPPVVAVSPPSDGSYLAVTGPCSQDRFGTCIMRLAGSTYETRNFDQPGPWDEGRVSLRKPGSIVFAPTAGFCYEPGRSTRPVTYSWTGSGRTLSFERTAGGRCGGPGFTGPWTRAPDGVIAVEQGGGIELVDVGGSLVGSTTLPVTSPNSWPDWSPDGSRIVFATVELEGLDLYTIDADDTGLTRITDEPGDEYTPAWSPDGRRIAFGFADEAETNWRSGLAYVKPDGSGWIEVLARTEERVESPTWSPDGARIAFTVFVDGFPEPYVVDADGGNLVRLLDEPGVALSWTPDGRRILVSAEEAFVSVRPDGSGKRVFYERPPEGGRLVIDWSPDGRWIVMSSPSGFGNNLYLMRSDGSQLFQIGLGTEPSWRPTDD